MLPKPKHLETQYGDQFQDESIVAAYQHRSPYPTELFTRLTEFIPASAQIALDVGCGTGDVARPLAALVERLDAVDISRPMIEKGGTLPGGDQANLHWIVGRVETAPLQPPYGLITAGESLHWLDWAVVMPRFAQMLTPDGYLAILGRPDKIPWREDLMRLIPAYTTNRDYQSYNIFEELDKRGLFSPLHSFETASVMVRQPTLDYIEAIHSRNGFSRDRMTKAAAIEFDQKFKELLQPYEHDGQVEFEVKGHVMLGRPLANL